MTGYKVVKKTENKYFSCWVGGKLKVEYKINKWVSANKREAKKGYGLTFFWFKDAAKDFLIYQGRSDADWVILNVKVKEVFEFLPKYEVVLWDTNTIHDTFYGRWPNETRMAKEIKLLEETPSHQVNREVQLPWPLCSFKRKTNETKAKENKLGQSCQLDCVFDCIPLSCDWVNYIEEVKE